MSFIERVTHRLRREYFQQQHRMAVRGILDTPPLKRGNTPFVLLSMVQSCDVLAYLAALKSLTQFTQPERVVVVCDPSMTPADRRTLEQHVPHIEMHDAAEFAHDGIPRGGTWERLYAIATLSPQSYVVQLDADTLTLSQPDDVLHAINACGAFVLGETGNQKNIDFETAAFDVIPFMGTNAHIQAIAETALPHVGLPPANRYVKGCSGFTGFPPNANMREQLLDFSGRMQRSLGEDWSRWGTEQVCSNYLVANSAGFQVLPFPRYATADVRASESVFLHYIGTIRFANADYARDTRRFVTHYKNT